MIAADTSTWVAFLEGDAGEELVLDPVHLAQHGIALPFERRAAVAYTAVRFDRLYT